MDGILRRLEDMNVMSCVQSGAWRRILKWFVQYNLLSKWKKMRKSAHLCNIYLSKVLLRSLKLLYQEAQF
jgi:hypothetical protein